MIQHTEYQLNVLRLLREEFWRVSARLTTLANAIAAMEQRWIVPVSELQSAIESLNVNDEVRRALDAYMLQFSRARIAARVKQMIGSGELTRLPCEECGSQPAWHRYDGDPLKPERFDPTLIRWLCPVHHYHYCKRQRRS